MRFVKADITEMSLYCSMGKGSARRNGVDELKSIVMYPIPSRLATCSTFPPFFFSYHFAYPNHSLCEIMELLGFTSERQFYKNKNKRTSFKAKEKTPFLKQVNTASHCQKWGRVWQQSFIFVVLKREVMPFIIFGIIKSKSKHQTLYTSFVLTVLCYAFDR